MNVREFFEKVYSVLGFLLVLGTMFVLGYALDAVHRNLYKLLVDATSVPTASGLLFIWSAVVLKKIYAFFKYMVYSGSPNKQNPPQGQQQLQQQQQQQSN